MPAFDPVRDAVLNSPTSTSPTLQRRATHLSVLLNDDPVPEKLDSSKPLRRARSPASSPSQSPIFDSRPSSSSSSAYPQPQRTPSATESPVMPPPPLPTTIPYDPKNRISRPASILTPMSNAEMEMYKSYVGKGTARLSKRKRGRSTDPDPHDEPPTKRWAGDVGVVVNHYNSRPDVGVVQRLDSPIIGLKNFNNWVKSVLISRFAQPALQSSPHSGRGSGRGGSGKVLDMGCGKGGDLTKWSKARIKELLAVDIAGVSVDQARARWETMKGSRFDADFATLDCYREPLTKAFPSYKLSPPFDAVSMQFCMHYAFETEEKARCMLDNVSRWLRPGGVFIGTIPNAELLLEHLHDVPPDQDDLSFGNSVYRIRFEERDHDDIYGHKYWFYLQDAVEDVPEYVVLWDNFVQLAAEYHLHPIYKEEFHQVYSENQDHKDFGPLLVRMKVVDSNGESAMDEDQWEAANIYIGFAFEKR
ncbi:mRNA cap guanine-N7 methyltransferase [Paramarasmius palmivorus]|uniref:mRNA cap guanine-N(7) methyltransferase n=1 Tax=Paramarasmius palmivorus TaxID=297713 RepID=A0AAW0CZE2_9AGAR